VRYRDITAVHTQHLVSISSPFFVSQIHTRKVKIKGMGQDTCYSAAYMSQTRDQQRFTILEVVADWQEPMVPQRIMWLSIARTNGQLDPRCSRQTHYRPNHPY